MEIHLTLLSLVLALVGGLVGLYSSVVGGGALLLIPLFTLLGLPLPAAIATMRFSSVFQQFISVLAFWKAGAVEWKPALWVGVFCIPGGILGAQIVLTLDERLLSYFIAGLMLVLLAVSFMVDRKKLKKKHKPSPLKWGILALTALGLGFYGGFYGAGFSTLIMFAYILTGGSTFITSSGNASVATLCMSIAASALFLKADLIDWDIFWPITIGGVIGSWIGVESAAKFGMGWIKKLLIVVVVSTVLKLVVFPT